MQMGRVLRVSLIMGTAILGLTACSAGDGGANPSANASSGAPSDPPSGAQSDAADTLPTQEFTGTDVDTIDVEFDRLAWFEFVCEECRGQNVMYVETYATAAVNHFGHYEGSHFVQPSDTGSVEFTIRAGGDWVITVADVANAPVFDGEVTGSGDAAFMLDASFERAKITHTGERNFKVHGVDGSGLVVNRVGAFDESVEISGPGLVEVKADGEWTITPE